MADKNSITQEYLLSRLSYDETSGMLIWKARAGGGRCVPSWNSRNAGKQAGRLDSTKYLQVAIDGIRYQVSGNAYHLDDEDWKVASSRY